MSSVFEGKSITKTILKIGLLIIMSIACVFGMGGSSVIARQLGEGNKDYSAKCLNFCIYSIAIAGPLTLALGLLVLTPFSYVIGADDGNLGYTRDYLKWIFMGAPFVMLANSSFLHLTITVLRNVALFIPGVIILNYFWQLDGVILTQLVVEGILLTVVCLVMYALSSPERIMK